MGFEEMCGVTGVLTLVKKNLTLVKFTGFWGEKEWSSGGRNGRQDEGESGPHGG
jgi:hypothetical protein